MKGITVSGWASFVTSSEGPLAAPFNGQLPVDLRVKAGVCSAHMGDLAAARTAFAPLAAGEESAADCGDLFLDAADALAAAGEHAR